MRRDWQRWSLWILGIFGVTLLVGIPALWHSFVYDDYLNIVQNEAFRGIAPQHLHWMFTEAHGGHYHPLTWLSFAANYLIHGLWFPGYAAVNILLHAVNATLAGALFARLFPQRAQAGWRWLVVAVTLFWALHPLRVEAVVWVTERRDVLSAFFLLLCLHAYLLMVRRSDRRRYLRWLLVALAMMLASLLSKAWAVTLPALLLLLDGYPLRREGWRRLLLEKVPFAGLAMVFAGLAWWAQSERAMATTADYGILERLVQAAYGLFFYLWKTIFPLGLQPLVLIPEEPFRSAGVIVGALAGIALIVAVSFQVKKRPGLAAAFGAYALLLLPVLGFFQSGSQLVADRYSYLAALPLSALLLVGLHQIFEKRPGWRGSGQGALALLLLVLAALTLRQESFWRDESSLWNRAVAVDPNNPIAYFNRAMRGHDRSDVDARLADLTRAIELRPNYENALNNRGKLFLARGDLAKAEADFYAARVIAPTRADVFNNLGALARARGNEKQALEFFQQAVALEPRFTTGYVNLGMLHQDHGRRLEALSAYQKALELNPRHADLYNRTGTIFFELRQMRRARDALNAAIALDPEFEEALMNRAMLRLTLMDLSGAREDFKAALQHAPENWAHRPRAEQLLGQISQKLASGGLPPGLLPSTQ